jgi:hypothetical protein
MMIRFMSVLFNSLIRITEQNGGCHDHKFHVNFPCVWRDFRSLLRCNLGILVFGAAAGSECATLVKAMEYRGVEYTVIVDERGNWQWAVSLGNPKKIKSGQAATKGTAILKVWAAIEFGGILRRTAETKSS